MARLTSDEVVIERCERPQYPARPPFSPAAAYPEAPFGDVSDEPNYVFAGVRACFLRAGLDAHNCGTSDWNPLGEFIRPGETVVLKPNLIKEVHPRDEGGWEYMLTHGSVIRAVADFVVKALSGSGRIIVADAPQTDSSFAGIVNVLGLDQLAAFYRERGIAFEIVDLRQEEWTVRDGVVVARQALAGDPRGNVAYDLRSSSEFVGHRGEGRYYGADYDSRAVNSHHTGGRHEYLVGRSVAQADVFINLPKLKTHKKAGITVALKNLVGINGNKNWLPHHTEGPPLAGGDEHPDPGALHRVERWAAARLRALSLASPRLGPLIHRQARRVGRPVFGDTDDVVRSGNWWGNDTIWRMCLDLNKLLMYGEPDGSLRAPGPDGRRRYLALVDGVIAGEGRGPINPDPVEAGVLLFGLNPASIDAAAAILMGFDPDCIPIVQKAFEVRHLPLAEWPWTDVRVRSGVDEWHGRLADISLGDCLTFRPHFAWEGHIERQPDRSHA
ncbi:MAG TPA: DUF362 domain-containing protein [Mycobacterium sp.]|nr:DUF362 domain-containing protein [Mycobacterium sp.]